MWIPNSSRCVLDWATGFRTWDSGFLVSGNWISFSNRQWDYGFLSWIPYSKAQDFGFHRQRFSGFRYLDYLTWSEAVVPSNNRGLKQRRRRRRRQRERQKGNRFRSAKQQLTLARVHHAFFCISLLSLHYYNVKVPNFTFCRGRERRQRLSFSFPELWYSLLEFHFRKICQRLANWTS